MGDPWNPGPDPWGVISQSKTVLREELSQEGEQVRGVVKEFDEFVLDKVQEPRRLRWTVNEIVVYRSTYKCKQHLLEHLDMMIKVSTRIRTMRDA
jgi:hypothetical protein